MTLLLLEDHQRLPAGGAVDAHSGDLEAPLGRFGPEVGQPVEAGALEEAFPGVGHAPFHLGLVFGMPHPGRVNEEAPVLSVFQEAPAQARMQGVRPHYCGREIVDDQVFGHTAEEGPGRLQSSDHVRQLLIVHGSEEAVTGVAQHDGHGPHQLAASRRWVRNQAQPAEVGLGHLPRRGVCHPHRGLAGLAPVALGDETAQGLVRHRASARRS